MAKKGKSTLIPIGGLDMDSEARSLPVDSYRYALNIRNGVAYINDQNVVTNVKGSVKVNYTLPAGVNKCIGTYEDKQNGTVIYFVQNSNEDDTILQYTPSDTTPFGTIVQLAQYNFGWTDTEFITGIDLVNGNLLYWTDSVMPRKLNIEKSALTGKLKTWDVFLPETLTVTNPIVFAFFDMQNVPFYNFNVPITNTTDRTIIIQDITSAINANPNSPVTAEACACSLIFTEKVAGVVGAIVTNLITPDFQNFLLSIVPKNWYGLSLNDRMCDAGKWMPLFEPLPTFEQDENYEPNYVQKKVFQFRLQYQYDDFEESALGVISQIPINNLGCDGTSNPLLNYIYIDFNEPELLQIPNLVLIKNVTVLAREHNEGNWRSIIILEPCDFLDTDADGNLVCRYKFYGDIGGRGVDLALVAKQYDNMPIDAGTQKFVKNRLNYGDVEIGRDAPDCIDAKAQMEFGDTPNPKLWKVSGLIRVFNYRLDNSSSLPPESTQPNILERRGAISYDTAMTYGDVAYPFFGGYFESNNVLQINADFAFNKKRQYLPEGGWAVYAAATDYFTISKQRTLNGVSQRADGSFDISTTVNKDLVIDVYDATSPEDIYSTFELLLPDGEYVIRLASHWCSFDDKLGRGFMYNLSGGRNYQKTSTYVWGVDDSPIGGSYKYNYEIKVTVSGADVYIGEFIVADLVFPNLSDDALVYPSHSGYLYDNFGQTDVISLSEGTIVDRGLVRNSVFNESTIYASYQQKITDHNGFFFTFPDEDFNSGGYANRFTAIQMSGVIHNSGTQYYEDVTGLSALALLAAQTITTAYPFSPIPSHLEIILPTDVATARDASSTFIAGIVKDANGDGISGVPVLLTHGRYAFTNQDGSYNILAWGDMGNTPPFSAPVNLREDYVIFNQYIFCQPSYPSGFQEVFVSITPFGINGTDTPPPYSPTAKFPVADFVIIESNNPSVKAHKRGGTYTYGLRLYDDLGRLCSVVKAFEMYVPFITEDIGKYDIEDFSSVVYPTGTFLYGKPSIKWVLDSTTTFPTYAKYFQWMRTQNSIYGRYLQWVANQVTYLSSVANGEIPEILTSFQNSDAVAIKVSLSNITSYFQANPDSQVSYSYQAGDRLRLIADRNLVNYSSDNFPSITNNVNDFEIISYDSTSQSVIIKPNGFPLEIKSGTLFEIFNPKSVETVDGQVFYEVGEVFTITNGVPDTFSGVFTNGDTYWHGRLIIVNDSTGGFSSAYPVVIESASPSDFYPSDDEDIGRAGLIDPNFKQLRYPTRMQCSNVYIAGTTINGLASFESLNFKELDRAFGTMKRMFYIGQVMLTVHENKLVSNYIELRSLSDANTTDGLLAISDAYYGNNRPSQTDNGCQHGESCIEYNGKVWGIDASKGLVWQYDNNGDDAISKYKMVSYFKDFCVKGVEWCIPAYDKYRNELIFSIKNSEETITVAYDNAKNRWATFYSFKPEYFGAVGTNVVSFVNGELWAMDKSSTYNLFYGVQYTSKLTIIPNDNSELNKVWDSVKLENLEDANKMINSWAATNITNNNGQQSRLLKNKFRKIEYFFYTSFCRDILDISVTNSILNGRELRSPYLIIEFENDTVGQFQLRSIVVDWTSSEKT